MTSSEGAAVTVVPAGLLDGGEAEPEAAQAAGAVTGSVQADNDAPTGEPETAEAALPPLAPAEGNEFASPNAAAPARAVDAAEGPAGTAQTPPGDSSPPVAAGTGPRAAEASGGGESAELVQPPEVQADGSGSGSGVVEAPVPGRDSLASAPPEPGATNAAATATPIPPAWARE
ncbi:MAG: hypothetical protein V3V06_03385, partial [Dehalococcoidia bacterium]